MELERKMARYQDGKLKNYKSCSLRFLFINVFKKSSYEKAKRTTPSAQYRFMYVKGEERWKDERKAPSVPIGGERWDEAPIHRLDVSGWWIWGGAERGKIGKRRKMRS